MAEETRAAKNSTKSAGKNTTGQSTAEQGTTEPGAEQEGGQTPSYEQAREELIEVVRRLETGGLTLEQSIELWERGERLAAICEEWLQGARAKLATAMAQRQDAQPNGPAEAPF